MAAAQTKVLEEDGHLGKQKKKEQEKNEKKNEKREIESKARTQASKKTVGKASP